MPDDFAPPPRPRVVPCVPRYPSVPATDGPREADEQEARDPDEIFRIPDDWSKTIGGPVRETLEHEPPTPDELEQARQARDLLNRLADDGKIMLRAGIATGDRLRIVRLVPRTVYDEEPLP